MYANSSNGRIPNGSETGLNESSVHLASIQEKKRLWKRNALINALFIASWYLFATLISVYNKWLFTADEWKLSDSHFSFPFPLFVTTIHMIMQFSLAAILRTFWPHHFRPKNKPSRRDYGMKVAPTAIATSLDIGLSNLSLKSITLSFYTMCKSSSLIFVLLFAFAFRLELYSLRLVGVILLIFSGVLLMVATEAHFIVSGFIMVISASALGGLRWALTSLLLKNKKVGLDNPAATVYWLAPVMGLTLAIISAIVEGWITIFRTSFSDGFGAAMYTLLLLSVPGIVAFCMVMSEFYIIQRAGVVPMSIAGIFKEVTTITISSWLFGDQLSPLNITGVAITVCGICLFTYDKYMKSINSTVALDTHGNPITDEGHDLALELSEREWLNPSQRHSEQLRSSDRPTELVFSAERDDDDDEYDLDGETDAEELGSIRSSKTI